MLRLYHISLRSPSSSKTSQGRWLALRKMRYYASPCQVDDRSTGQNMKPHKVIGPVDNPYMLRWFIFKVGNLPRIYVHKFCRSDDDRGLHDHPWWFVSIILRGKYIEHTREGQRVRCPGSIAFRRSTDCHRVELFNRPAISTVRTRVRPQRQPEPVWTLFITGRVVRQWGFWCEKKPYTATSCIPVAINSFYGEVFVPANEFDGCE